MQANDVELRHGRVIQQLRKICFTKFNILQPGRLRERASTNNVGRIEVGRENPGSRIGGRDNVCGEPLPAAKIAIRELFAETSRGRNAFRKGREAQDGGYLDTTEVMHVSGVGDVPGSPFSHA